MREKRLMIWGLVHLGLIVDGIARNNDILYLAQLTAPFIILIVRGQERMEITVSTGGRSCVTGALC